MKIELVRTQKINKKFNLCNGIKKKFNLLDCYLKLLINMLVLMLIKAFLVFLLIQKIKYYYRYLSLHFQIFLNVNFPYINKTFLKLKNRSTYNEIFIRPVLVHSLDTICLIIKNFLYVFYLRQLKSPFGYFFQPRYSIQ